MQLSLYRYTRAKRRRLCADKVLQEMMLMNELTKIMIPKSIPEQPAVLYLWFVWWHERSGVGPRWSSLRCCCCCCAVLLLGLQGNQSSLKVPFLNCLVISVSYVWVFLFKEIDTWATDNLSHHLDFRVLKACFPCMFCVLLSAVWWRDPCCLDTTLSHLLTAARFGVVWQWLPSNISFCVHSPTLNC